jgi:hypothetical protein
MIPELAATVRIGGAEEGRCAGGEETLHHYGTGKSRRLNSGNFKQRDGELRD